MTPESAFLRDSASYLSLPAADGALGVLPGHMKLIVQLQPGIMEINFHNGTRRALYISEGIAQIDALTCWILVSEVEDRDMLTTEYVTKKINSVQQKLESPKIATDAKQRLQKEFNFFKNFLAH